MARNTSSNARVQRMSRGKYRNNTQHLAALRGEWLVQ
jgi:hypothetical protein